MYEAGLGVAFLLWLYRTAARIVLVNSRMQRNLRKVGCRLSWLDLELTQMDDADAKRSPARETFGHLIAACVSLPLVILSWLDVLLTAGMIIYRLAKDRGAPDAVREFRWKLRNMDLSFDELILGMMKVKGVPDEQFLTTRQQYIELMKLNGSWHGAT